MKENYFITGLIRVLIISKGDFVTTFNHSYSFMLLQSQCLSFARFSAKELGMFLHCCLRHWYYSRGFLWPFLVTSKSYIISLKSGIKGYRNSYKASIKSRPHMARITVSTIKDKRERNQTPVFPKSCTPEGFYILNPELDFYIPWACIWFQ